VGPAPRDHPGGNLWHGIALLDPERRACQYTTEVCLSVWFGVVRLEGGSAQPGRLFVPRCNNAKRLERRVVALFARLPCLTDKSRIFLAPSAGQNSIQT
jgi:hypothetical protein